MGKNDNMVVSDALVVFGATGDLARRKIFPALYSLSERGVLQVPVIGVAASKWTVSELRERVRDAITSAGDIDESPALDRFLSLLDYVSGDYNNPDTFKKLRKVLGEARTPLFYLAIPPALFETVIKGLAGTGPP